MRPGTETRTPGAQIVFSGTAIQTLAANVGRGFRDDPVALAKPLHAGTHFGNCAAEFMSEHDGYAHRPALGIVVLMDIAPADADRANSQEYVLFPYCRHGRLTQFNRKRFESVVHDAAHHICHSRTLRVISLNKAFKSPAATLNE